MKSSRLEHHARHAIPADPRKRLHLYDLILAAVHGACDLGEFETAAELLAAAEAAIMEPSQLSETRWRHALEALVAANERLWTLRHQGCVPTPARAETHCEIAVPPHGEIDMQEDLGGRCHSPQTPRHS